METLVQTNAATLVELLHRELHRQDCPLTLDMLFQEWQEQRNVCKELDPLTGRYIGVTLSSVSGTPEA